MPDILPILWALSPSLPTTTCRQLHCIVTAMLSMTGRITQLGLSRWTEQGGSYRTIQRFFQTPIDWLEVQWLFFLRFFRDKDAVYLLAGDESVVHKAGKRTYGVDWFFSSIAGKAIPGLAFFSVALIDVKQRQAYSLATEQVVRTDAEKEQAKQRKAQHKARAQETGTRRSVGRPKGSQNKNKAQVTLSPELSRILAQTKKVIARLGDTLRVHHYVLDGHFGNHLACAMVRQMDLHLISKMSHNAELYLMPSAEEKTRRPRLKYGARIDYAHLPEASRCSSSTEDGVRTDVYQMPCRHKKFADPINVVILVRTDLQIKRVGHLVLFSSDLWLEAAVLIDYYALRFQIEFTFRDAKQSFGLEDFMAVKEISVANAVGLSFFMVNLSNYLLLDLRKSYPDAGINDLRSYYRARHYVAETLKYVSEKPDRISCEDLVGNLCRRLFIHPRQDTQTNLKRAA